MAEQPPTQRCGNCRYYKERDPDQAVFAHAPQADNTFPDVTGFCVWLPPVLLSFSERMGSIPGTVEDHWCGQWTSANPETISDAAVTLARFVVAGDKTAAFALVDKLKEE